MIELTAIIPVGHPIARPVLSQEGDWVIVDISTTPRPLPKAYKRKDLISMDIVDKNTGEVTQAEVQPQPEEVIKPPKVDEITNLKAQIRSLKSELEVARAMRASAERKLETKEQEHRKALEDAQHKALTDHKFGELASLKKTNAELTNTISKLKTALNNAHRPDQPIEVTTIIGNITFLLDFNENLANHINDGWKIITTGDLGNQFLVIMSRPKADEQPTQQIAVKQAPLRAESSLSAVKEKIVTTFTDMLRLGVSPDDLIKACDFHAVKIAKQQYQQQTGVTL